MIRHSSALFISLIFHTFLLFLLLYIYKNSDNSKKVLNSQKLVHVQLSTFVERKSTEVKVMPKPIFKPMPVRKVVKKKVQKKVLKHKKLPKKEEMFTKELLTKVEEEKEKEPVVEKILEQNITKEKEKIEIAQVSQKSDIVIPEIPQEKSISAEEVYINKNIELIRNLIKENLYYPRNARKRGLQGKVVVKVVLSNSGELQSISIISSEDEILSRAAIKTIENIKSKFPKSTQTLTLEIPIVYALK